VSDAGARASALAVGGFVPFTATDYPGALAAVVFCQGCPWRCGYCQNPHLVPAREGADPQSPERLRFEQILQLLAQRQRLLDAVVFSGGEPTAQPALAASIGRVRALGFRIGLHTAGAYPRRLAEVLGEVDWVGLDIKATRAAYAGVTGAARSGEAAFASLERILAAGIAYEVRTTVHPALTPPATLETIARELAARGVRRWVLQPFRATGCADQELVAMVPGRAKLGWDVVAQLSRHVPRIHIRE
jgi:pyruvate formate lyase activating enzyme